MAVLHERELDVMNVLWERGPCTVAEVREALPDPLAYTTVLTVLRTLEEKGYIAHQEEGRAYRYLPRLERRTAAESAIQRLTRKLFRGSAEQLMTHLAADRRLGPEEIRRIRALLDERLEEEPER